MAMYCECPKCSGVETDDNYFDICQNEMMHAEIKLAKSKVNSGTYSIIIGLCLFVIIICSFGITVS